MSVSNLPLPLLQGHLPLDLGPTLNRGLSHSRFLIVSSKPILPNKVTFTNSRVIVPGPDPAPVQPPRGSALLSFHPIPPHPHLAPVFIGLIGLVKPEASQLTNLQHQSESCQETELPPDDSPEET